MNQAETPHDPYAALRHTGYRNYLIGGFCANVGRQMATVAVAWQIYQWTHSATALGLVGLLHVLPLLVLSLPAGVLADRVDRKSVIAVTNLGVALLAVLLAAVTQFHHAIPSIPAFEALLLGGAVALLPIYAAEILHVGPIGLGWLRAAPGIGAFGMATWLAHRRPLQQPGATLLWAVGGFGTAIIVFGLSSWFWLSLLALFFTGVFDNMSVVVRQSLVQILTPDALRGRVTAVNQIFIGSSNEIGTLRAGLMSALVGPVAAVVWGGVGTIAITLCVARYLPQLRATPALDKLRGINPPRNESYLYELL